jgi:DNA-binding CsgD family transcriptional regulator
VPETLLPGFLRHRPAFEFVGREQELETLRTLLPLAPGSSRRIALIAGEPGAGKSRLVRELAAEVGGAGGTVLCGSCDSVIRVPFGPFAEALEQLLRRPLERPDPPAATALELARLVPGLASGDAQAPSSIDPDTDRHRLHVAVADLLAAASHRSQVLLVLEDIHWADRPTLLLLRHLLRSGSDARLLLVATYRDAEADVAPELSETLVEAWRTEGVARLRLGGLSADEIREFVRLNSGAEPADRLVTELAGLSGGNPFLLTELWRELQESDALQVSEAQLQLARPMESLATPESVRAVVGQRVDRLAASATTVLEIAAVAGTEFELATLRLAAALPEGDLLDAVDEAERSGLIVAVPSRGLAYRFSHELVRRSVSDRLSAQRRAALHLRVAEALEREGSAGERGLTALAHHFAAASAVGGSERAISYNLLAARAAADALAFEEAATHLQTALSLGIADQPGRAEAQLELGHASHRAGDSAAALEAFTRTAELARALGDAQLLARAAIGFEEACWRPAIHDGRSLELLLEAAASLEDADSEARARLLGGLARAFDLHGERDRAARARDESVAMSRRLGDLRGLGRTLAGAYWARGTSTPEEINLMLTEALEIADELDDEEIRTEALGWLVPSAVALLDHAAARRVLAELFEAARRQKQPFYLHVAEHYASALALCDGDMAAAEAAAMRSHEWSRLLTGRDASGVHGIQMFSLRREQGRLAELAPVARMLAGSGSAAWRPGLAALLAELGMAAEAQRELTRASEEELELHRRSLWLAALSFLTDATAALGDVLAAERLYPQLEPYAGSSIVVGHLVVCYGAADRYLGMLATVLGEWDLAEGHFESALALNRRLGARTWEAHTIHQHARMLLARGGAHDKASAGAQLSESLALAESIGLDALASATRGLGAGRSRVHSGGDGLTARESQILALVARGHSNREIGRSLYISEHTVANHIRSILRKTGCANRTQAAAYAHSRGLLDGA